MSNQVTNYKCPACTAPLKFVPWAGQLECEFCGSRYTVREIEALYETQNQNAANAAEAEELHEDLWGEGAERMRAYSCPSCSAQLICEDTTAATSCPYCGNPTIIPSQFQGVKRPDYVIPFRLDKKQAVAALKAHCRKKPLLPRAFWETKHIREIKGVYVPFWLYDGVVDADVSFAATRTTSTFSGNRETIHTDHYKVRRAGQVVFEQVPADGSSTMPNDYMDAIEPYDYSQMVPFAMAYLPGYLADCYDITADQAYERVKMRMEFSAELEMENTVTGYESCSVVKSDVKVKRGESKYALLPVWLLHTKYEGKDYLYAMNGQTGKVVGELPVSRKRYWAWFAGIAAGSAAILSGLLALFM